METLRKRSEPASKPRKRPREGGMQFVDVALDRLMGALGYVSSAALAWMSLTSIETLAAIAAAGFTAIYHAIKSAGYLWDRYQRWRENRDDVAA